MRHNRVRWPHLAAALFALWGIDTPAIAGETRLLRHPDLSEQHVVFSYGGDLWITGREGGDARRLTSSQGFESSPRFSPDGSQVAFAGQYDGNVDVFVVPVTGGEPERLTWHPGADLPRAWTPDGRRVVFASGRTGAPVGYPKLWSVGLDGGMPEAMPMPRAWRGKFSPDGIRFAYEPVASWENEWRNYRGGQNKPIWVLDFESLAVEKLPWDGSNDSDPVWLGDKLYFLSDRDWAVNLYSWDPADGTLEQLTEFKQFDAKRLESGGGALIFECAGYLHVYDPAAAATRRLEITVRGDFPWTRPHWEEASRGLRNGAISPAGKRAVFESRGEIFTIPADKGDVRNLSHSAGSAERSPAWSPDGKHISWFSDAGGEYRLVIADQFGNDRREIELDSPTFYYTPLWSPDSESLAFGDADRNLWVVDVASGEATRIDNEGYAHPLRTIYPEWSPDSQWIAYTKRLDNQYNSIWVYSIAGGESHQLTDGMSDSLSPAWDKGGKYLYFLASTDFGLNVGWLDMSSYQRPTTRAVYLAVLAADEPSPLLPESDDEETGEEDEAEEADTGPAAKKKGKKKAEDENGEEDEEVVVEIDFDGIDQRIVALGIEEGDYFGVAAGAEGKIFYLEAGDEPRSGGRLHRYDLEERESEELLDEVTSAVLSADGSKLLYGQGSGKWAIADAGGKLDPGEDALEVSEVRLEVDPAAEWAQIFREAWRYQRDFFYVENVHGLDLEAVYEKYSPWVAHVRHRTDLTHLLDILGGETAIGHSFTGGGDNPDVETVPVGLLGADFEIADGLHRIAKIYSGENWNPELRAPLSGPGIDVRTGDYLFAVNGVELDAGTNVYSLFARTAGKQTVLTVGQSTAPQDRREVTVVPVESEGQLRRRDWVESNRRRVSELSDGRLAYVWLPNTGFGGYTYFNRYYFAQMDKKGAIVDERWNGGGSAADYMVDLMARPLMGYFNNPVGDKKPFTNPNAGIWGPKVMIINDAAGSGGDLLPYMFRLRGIGPLVGTRTWGGLVGIWDVPNLVDGGFITAPRGGYFNNDGEWDVENIGVAPDYEVEMLPAEVAAGRDPQLEKAVEVALELLATEGVELRSQPPDPVRVRWPE